MRLIDIDNITALDIMHNVICDDKVAHKMLEFLKDQDTIQPQGIDKDRLIEEIRKLREYEHEVFNSRGYYDEITCISKDNVIKIINQQPTSDGWIPVSERLPDKDNSYEVTVEYADGTRTTTTLWFDKVWEEWHHAEATAIAWRERLPQPYKESE